MLIKILKTGQFNNLKNQLEIVFDNGDHLIDNNKEVYKNNFTQNY